MEKVGYGEERASVSSCGTHSKRLVEQSKNRGPGRSKKKGKEKYPPFQVVIEARLNVVSLLWKRRSQDADNWPRVNREVVLRPPLFVEDNGVVQPLVVDSSVVSLCGASFDNAAVDNNGAAPCNNHSIKCL